MKLTIELVPSSSWYNNVRSEVSRKEWDIIRKKCYADANHVCEICGGVGKRHPVECHEIWNYDDNTNVQTLVGFIALCPSCHGVKHSGLTINRMGIEVVIRQLMKVNKISRDYSIRLINSAFDLWSERSKKSWEVDISYLDL